MQKNETFKKTGMRFEGCEKKVILMFFRFLKNKKIGHFRTFLLLGYYLLW